MKQRKHLLIALAAMFVIPSFLGAQDVPQERGPDRRGGGRRGGFMRGMDAMYDRISRELQLDETQQAELEDIRAQQRERWDNFRVQRDAIRQAEADGDQAQAQQLRDEMRARRDEGARRGGPMAEVIDSINGILTPEQQAQFTTLRTQMRSERDEQMRKRFEDRYARVAEELQLDEDQQAVLDEVKAAQLERMQAMRERWQQVREAYDSGNEALGDQLRDELRTEMRDGGGPRGFMREAMEELDPVLTDEQRAIAEDMRDRRGNRWQNRAERRRAGMEGEPAAGDGGPEFEDAPPSPEQLPEALGLDANQKSAYAALLQTRNQDASKLEAEIAQVNQQIETARANGETARGEELNQHLASLVAMQEDQESKFYAQVEALLDDEQKLALADYRAEVQIADDLKNISADLRTVLRAAMRLKLNREQKTEIRDMAKEARKLYRKARETDRKNRDRGRSAEKALANQMKNRIVALLDEGQVEKYTQTLERMAPKRRGDRRF